MENLSYLSSDLVWHVTGQPNQSTPSVRANCTDNIAWPRPLPAFPRYPQEQMKRVRHQYAPSPVESKGTESRFYKLFYTIPVSMIVVNCASAVPTVVAANRRAEAVFGYSAQQFKQLPVTRLTNNAMSHQLIHCLHQIKETWSLTMDAPAICHDGATFSARLVLTAGITQSTSNIIISIEDLSINQTKCEQKKVIDGERQRIAREIHDGVAQDLAALSLQTRFYQRQLTEDPAGLSRELDTMREILDTALAELRRTICDLRPIALEEHGLVAALHGLAAEFSAQHPLFVHINITGNTSNLPSALEHPLFRMAQEALHNVVQHAQASLVEITLVVAPNGLSFSIQDNGCGLTTDALWEKVRSGHLGLQQMKERIAAHHGVLSINSEIDQGTQILATFAC